MSPRKDACCADSFGIYDALEPWSPWTTVYCRTCED
jgi:hypothetical protein